MLPHGTSEVLVTRVFCINEVVLQINQAKVLLTSKQVILLFTFKKFFI